MTLNGKILSFCVFTAFPILALAQAPVATVDPQSDGNLARAQESIIQAFNDISAAQTANDARLGGHAGRAKDLLRQANDEITAAATVADGNTQATPPTNSSQTNQNPPAPTNISGNWTIYAYNADRPGSSLKQVQLNQNGNILSGTFHGPNQHGKLQGWITGNHVEFSTDTRDVLTFHGEITESRMSGVYGVNGRSAPWSAERTQ